MMIEVDDDFLNKAMIVELKQTATWLKADLERHGRGEYAAVFSTNPTEDTVKIYDMIQAITKICNFYGAHDV